MPPKFDGIIEAARYDAEGRLLVVKAYERRGAAYSDVVLLDRQTLVERLKAHQRFVTGKRVYKMGGTFQVSERIRLARNGDQEMIATGKQPASHDTLEGVPIF